MDKKLEKELKKKVFDPKIVEIWKNEWPLISEQQKQLIIKKVNQ